MKLKLTIEIVADNHEQMLKAIDNVKKDYDAGAIYFSTKNYDGYNYKGELMNIE